VIPRRHHVARRAGLIVALGVAALWFLFLRPASLGGPATYIIVSGESMLPSLRAGDFVVAAKTASYRTGDVVVFRVPRGQPGGGTPIIHRIVAGSAAGGYVLRGDNREFRDPWMPTGAEIEGKSVLTIPRLGLLLVFLRAPLGLATVAGLLTFLFVAGGGREKTRAGPTILGRA
jgi:signal peptidase